MENKISVVINTYNAEDHLREVVESVKDFDEVLICDMESTDATVKIAREMGCKVVTFPKADHKSAEPARTFAIQSAQYDWVLVVDADELVTPELKDYLYRQIELNEYQGFYIPRRNFFMHRFMHSTYPDYQLRFFIKEGTEWPPYVHTFPKVNGRLTHLPKTKSLAFIHLADDSISTRLKKTDQYTDNEVYKKKNRHFGIFSFLWRPFFRFFQPYIIKGGFRDGLPGFIYACLEGYYQIVMLAKIKESKCQKK